MKFESKIYLSYDDIDSMCRNLEEHVSALHPDLIVGIARGGCLPALHLSHALSVPMKVIQWQTRDDKIQHIDQDIIKLIKDKKTVVFVDDINDSGLTFKQIYHAYNGGVYVSMVERVGSDFNSDVRSIRFDDTRWIVFPWEKS